MLVASVGCAASADAEWTAKSEGGRDNSEGGGEGEREGGGPVATSLPEDGSCELSDGLDS